MRIQYTKFPIKHADNSFLPLMEQHQVKLMLEATYSRDQCWVPIIYLIHISDINNDITDSTESGFADDTQIVLGIKDEETPK